MENFISFSVYFSYTEKWASFLYFCNYIHLDLVSLFKSYLLLILRICGLDFTSKYSTLIRNFTKFFRSQIKFRTLLCTYGITFSQNVIYKSEL